MITEQQKTLAQLFAAYNGLPEQEKFDEITEKLDDMITGCLRIAANAAVSHGPIIKKDDIKGDNLDVVFQYVCVLEDLLGKIFQGNAALA